MSKILQFNLCYYRLLNLDAKNTSLIRRSPCIILKRHSIQQLTLDMVALRGARSCGCGGRSTTTSWGAAHEAGLGFQRLFTPRKPFDSRAEGCLFTGLFLLPAPAPHILSHTHQRNYQGTRLYTKKSLIAAPGVTFTRILLIMSARKLQSTKHFATSPTIKEPSWILQYSATLFNQHSLIPRTQFLFFK